MFIPRKEILSKGTYRIYGPCKIKNISAKIFFLGRLIREGDYLFVPAYSTSSVNIMKEGEVELIRGPEGRIEKVRDEDEPLEHWIRICDDIIKKRFKTVVVVGETDSGKSSFSAFLLNYALEHGLKTAFIDADLGQNDIGVPGTIASKYLEKTICSLRELEADELFFVGSITPYGNEELILVGSYMLSRKASKKSDLVVVNTDGWVTGYRARRYKIRLIEILKPDALVILEGEGKAIYIKKIFEKILQTYLAPTPKIRVVKEREIRRFRRASAYVNLLLQSSVKVVDLQNISVLSPCIFTSNKLEKNINLLYDILNSSFLRIDICDDTAVIIVSRSLPSLRKISDELKRILKIKKVLFIHINDLRGLLVGLLDKHLSTIGIGIISKIDFKNGKIWIKTPLERIDLVYAVRLGSVKLTDSGEERVNIA